MGRVLFHIHTSILKFIIVMPQFPFFKIKILLIKSHNLLKGTLQTEKQFCNAYSNNLEIRIYKEFQINMRKDKFPIKKWTKDMNRQLIEQKTQMSNKHFQRYSTSLEISQCK